MPVRSSQNFPGTGLVVYKAYPRDDTPDYGEAEGSSFMADVALFTPFVFVAAVLIRAGARSKTTDEPPGRGGKIPCKSVGSRSGYDLCA